MWQLHLVSFLSVTRQGANSLQFTYKSGNPGVSFSGSGLFPWFPTDEAAISTRSLWLNLFQLLWQGADSLGDGGGSHSSHLWLPAWCSDQGPLRILLLRRISVGISHIRHVAQLLETNWRHYHKAWASRHEAQNTPGKLTTHSSWVWTTLVTEDHRTQPLTGFGWSNLSKWEWPRRDQTEITSPPACLVRFLFPAEISTHSPSSFLYSPRRTTLGSLEAGSWNR